MFRAEVVKLVLAQGLTLQEASQRISMSKGRFILGGQCSLGRACGCPWSVYRGGAELDLESKQLRKELAQIRIERDIVKAATYFARDRSRYALMKAWRSTNTP